MRSFYYTFGSDPEFPFGRDDYVEVRATDHLQADLLFSQVHPKRQGSGLINCSFVYTQDEWASTGPKYYGDRPPAEIIELTVRKGAET